ncbi:MAG: hypothetical protein KG075_07455 [Alphaproteobacteria bacterium]|nr:hypothetical protein [Alphaproteobacteria bacterium]
MPIKPENAALYPDNWPEISDRIKRRDRHRCKFCGVKDGALGARHSDGRFFPALPIDQNGDDKVYPVPGTIAWCGLLGEDLEAKIIRIVLTVAHLYDPNPANCEDWNLGALCQRCHNILDMPMRRRNAAATRHGRKAAADLFNEGGPLVTTSTLNRPHDDRAALYKPEGFWVVFSSPADYPNKFVARYYEGEWSSNNQEPRFKPTTQRILSENIDDVRRQIQDGRGQHGPLPSDPPEVMECWV